MAFKPIARMKPTKPIKRDYLFINYLANFREVRPHHLSSLRLRCIKASVFFLAYLCNVDTCANGGGPQAGREPSKWWRPQPFGLKYLKYSAWWQRQRYTWLADVILLVYVLSNVHLALNMYYQYSLDFDKLRMMRLETMLKQGLVGHHEFERLAVILLERIDGTASTLREIGAPYRHMSMIIECVQLYIVLFALILYYCGYLYYRLYTQCDFHFVRDLLDPAEERRHLEWLIEREVSRFMESDKVFANLDHSELFDIYSACNQVGSFSFATQDRLSLAPERPRGVSIGPRGSSHEAPQHETCSLISAARDQREIHDTLRRMHQSGALRPFNKSLDALKRRNNHLFLGLVFLPIFSLLFFSSLIQSSLARRDTSAPFSWKDLLTFGELLGLLFIVSSSSTLMCALFFASSLDQAIMVNKMRELVLECINQNEYEFQLLNASRELYSALRLDKRHRSDASRAARAKMCRHIEASLKVSVHKMNANFLFILLQYKIFLAQYQLARRALRTAVPFVVSLTLLIPIIVKLHRPYLHMFNFSNIKWLAVAVGPAVLLPANFVLVPICHLDARFMNLYRSLSSLLAHITEIESQPNGHGIYDEHAFTLLLKELSHTYEAADQPDTQVVSIAATYTTLVKTHFWLGLVAISILADSQEYGGAEQLSTSFFADPFGVFSPASLLEIL